MFGSRANSNSLEAPPLAKENGSAIEVLRVWAAAGAPQQVTLRPTWKDPAAWGLLLVDVARHAAQAYACEGRDPAEALARIREAWDVEWADPTDEPLDITRKP
jgi:hypothetical protein